MAFDARAIEIMIASPSDVVAEREIVCAVVAGWNAVYARSDGVVLLPAGWDTHSSPEMSARPQQLINDRLLVHADILVGIFWTRVGSPTGKAISGSIEEIEEHRRAGKPVMLYFSSVPVVPGSYDLEQFEKLMTFKRWALANGLVAGFESSNDFSEQFQRQLPITLRDNAYIRQLARPRKDNSPGPLGRPVSPPAATADEFQLLKAAADGDGRILMVDVVGGLVIDAGDTSFADGTPRAAARWRAAVQSLKAKGLILDSTGEGQYFETSDAGYRLLGT